MRIWPVNEPRPHDEVFRVPRLQVGVITSEPYTLEGIGSKLATPRHPGGRR